MAFPFLIPAVGILVCGFIWIHLSQNAQILGALWGCVGLVVVWILQRRNKPTLHAQ